MRYTDYFLILSFFLLSAIGQDAFSQNRFQKTIPSSTYVHKPLDQMYQVGQQLDAQMEAQIEAEHQQTLNQISNLKAWYSSQTTFNNPVDNTWNIVTVTDNYSICGLRKVFVSAGKVTRYIGADGITELTVMRQGIVSNGKATVQLFESGDFVDIYF